MASTSSLIKRHIACLSEETIFTTRDMLSYGKRNAVDKTMYKLVKNKDVYRIARGVFCKSHRKWRDAAPAEVARIKAAAFGRAFSDHSPPVPRRFARRKNVVVFAINGRTSSFLLRHGIRVVLRGTVPRNMHLGEGKAAQVAKHFWNMGNPEERELPGVRDAFQSLGDLDKQELLAVAHLLPYWITNAFWRLLDWRQWAAITAMYMKPYWQSG